MSVTIYSLAADPNDSRKCEGSINISDTEWRLFQYCEASDWNLAQGFKEWVSKDKPSMCLIRETCQDKKFWRAIRAHAIQNARSALLNTRFLKDQLVASMVGDQLSNRQLQAINLSMKMLGVGQNSNRGKVIVQPNKIEVEFATNDTSALPSQENVTKGILGPSNEAIEIEDKP